MIEMWFLAFVISSSTQPAVIAGYPSKVACDAAGRQWEAIKKGASHACFLQPAAAAAPAAPAPAPHDH